MKRLTFIWVTLAGLATAFGRKTLALAASAASVPLQVVNAFYAIYHGPYRGIRSNHAKGIVCDATFKPTPAAASLSSAPHFQQSVKATVRLSDAGGFPNVPDFDDSGNPKGLAVKFHLPDGSDTDIVGLSVPLFGFPTAEDFLEFLRAIKAGPSAVGQYAAAHPAAAKFLEALKPRPASFATTSYHYFNAFRFTNAKGESHFVRYTMKAVAAEAFLSPEQAKQQDPNYLFADIRKRLANGPVEFDYLAQVAAAGDPTGDCTKAWPTDRNVVMLGRLTITKVVADSDAVQRKLLFDPVRLTNGIDLSDDPLPRGRSQAYAISYANRLRT